MKSQIAIVMTVVTIIWADQSTGESSMELDQQFQQAGVINRLSYRIVFLREPSRITTASGYWNRRFLVQIPRANYLKPDVKAITDSSDRLLEKLRDLQHNNLKIISQRNINTGSSFDLMFEGANNLFGKVVNTQFS